MQGGLLSKLLLLRTFVGGLGTARSLYPVRPESRVGNVVSDGPSVGSSAFV